MMPSLDDLLVIMGVAFAAPLVLGLFPRVQLPSVVLEIVAGIVVGPAVLGWAEVDQAVEVVALIGLAFVLFLAGLEIELEKLRGPLLRLTVAGFGRAHERAVDEDGLEVGEVVRRGGAQLLGLGGQAVHSGSFRFAGQSRRIRSRYAAAASHPSGRRTD